MERKQDASKHMLKPYSFILEWSHQSLKLLNTITLNTAFVPNQNLGKFLFSAGCIPLYLPLI